MFERLLSRPIYLAAMVAAIAFIVYLQTLAPSVDWIDAGELATDCYTLGIAHPTGYPLFTLIGWVFSHLPIASSIIVRLNLMAAFFTALGAGGMVLLASELFQNWMPQRVKKPVLKNLKGKAQPQKKGKQRNAVAAPSSRRDASTPNTVGGRIATSREIAQVQAQIPFIPNLAAFATGLAAAFSATWWNQSTSIEVYPLHLFFVPLVLFFFLRMLRNEESEKIQKDGILFALLLGLSFTNHMTTILLAPACLYMFFARYRFSKLARNRIVRLGPFFIAPLLLYGFMLIRSAQYPLMDWGHPATFGALIRHVTAKQFQVWMYTGSGAAAKQFAYFWSRVPKEFTIVGAFLALLGLWKMLNAASIRRTHILAFTLLLFFGCLFYSINYDIHDIDSYFLLAFLTMALWIGAGILAFNRTAPLFSRWAPWIFPKWRIVANIAGLMLLLILVEIWNNCSENDESGNYMVQDFTLNMLRNLPPHAIVFSTLWDFWVSGDFYYQLVEHVRPDVLVIDKAMLRDRPWYYAELEKRAPDVFARVKPEEEAFLTLLKAFDEGRPFNEAGIAPAYQSFTTALIEKNLDRPIFITQEMVDQRDDLFAPTMKIVPAGVAYRLWPRDTVYMATVPNETWDDKNYRRRDYYTDDARLMQAVPLERYAGACLARHDTSTARAFLGKALLFTPDLDANIDALPDRDREIADAANENFTQLRAMKAQLH